MKQGLLQSAINHHFDALWDRKKYKIDALFCSISILQYIKTD